MIHYGREFMARDPRREAPERSFDLSPSSQSRFLPIRPEHASSLKLRYGLIRAGTLLKA